MAQLTIWCKLQLCILAGNTAQLTHTHAGICTSKLVRSLDRTHAEKGKIIILTPVTTCLITVFTLNIGPQPCTKGVAWLTIFILSMDDLKP